MNLLILKGFNNYFNRIIKRHSTLAEYITNSEAHYEFSDINFNPNDGVTTTQVIGNTAQQQTGGPDPVPLAWEHDGNPDYIIAYETEKVGNATVTTIKSRWFIVESVRTRNGQYSLKLKRDSIADHLDTLLTCPAFIKKGTVSDDNPLILNDEGVTVNQIKSSETLLKDGTGSAWIVGYLSKDFVNKADDTQPIAIQIPDGEYTYVTIEDLATELGVSEAALESILVADKDNQAYFINDNIEMVGWINMTEGSPLEWRLKAGSQNFLDSFTYQNFDSAYHSNTSDCFAKEDVRDYWGRLKFTGLGSYWLAAVNAYKTQIKTAWSTFTAGKPFLTQKVYRKLQDLQKDNILIYKAGVYYTINIGNATVTNTGETYFGSATTEPFNSVCNKIVNDWNTAHPDTGPTRARLSRENMTGKVFVNFNELKVNLYLTVATTGQNIPSVEVDISTSRNGVLNQPFDMFAMPFNDTLIVNGLDSYEVVGEYAQKLAMQLMLAETNGQIYDIQLLPYCPFKEMIGNGSIDITGLSEHYDYDFIVKHDQTETFISDGISPTTYPGDRFELYAVIEKPNGTGTLTASDISVIWNTLNHTNETLSIVSQTSTEITVSVVFDTIWLIGNPSSGRLTWTYTNPNPIIKSIIIYPKENSFSIPLNYNLSLSNDMKIEAVCNKYRLVSPNYQGSFDFSVARNGGNVSGFIAEFTYKPYTPYIKVAPNFGWMYNMNYGDARGLICGGDFSIGFYSSAWEEYQLNNKNYQNIFNREIQNLDVAQSIQRTQQYVSGGLNIVRDAIGGGVGGGLASGSPYGAIAGAAVGGIGSGIGYGIDMNLMEKGLQEQRQFSIDKYRMQLENIQALPYTLTKVGAFNINSKVWPFLEFYTCTDTEKEALRMKIQYEGMTVGIVDYLGNYMNGGYVQADLIRNEIIIEDSHQLDDIYIELTKGVYM